MISVLLISTSVPLVCSIYMEMQILTSFCISFIIGLCFGLNYYSKTHYREYALSEIESQNVKYSELSEELKHDSQIILEAARYSKYFSFNQIPEKLQHDKNLLLNLYKIESLNRNGQFLYNFVNDAGFDIRKLHDVEQDILNIYKLKFQEKHNLLTEQSNQVYNTNLGSISI